MKLATINFIWIGNKLGNIHVACIQSFLNHGHKVLMHCYEDIIDLPENVEVRDANKLLPISRMIRYKNGSPAIFADLLRYEIQAQELGLYVDTDIYCLKPIEDAEYIFGWESDKHINNAVLKLPKHSATLKDLLTLKDEKAFIPPWIKKRRQQQYKIKALLGFPTKLERLPWGTTGPRALSYFLKQNKEEMYAKPIDYFYPLPGHYLPLLLDPELTIDSLVTPRTKLIHLWNGSNLNQLVKKHGIAANSILACMLKKA